MARQDVRAKAIATGGKEVTSGRMMVMYRKSNGTLTDCVVLGAGTSSGLKIKMQVCGVIVDNVPKSTTLKGAGYIYLT